MLSLPRSCQSGFWGKPEAFLALRGRRFFIKMRGGFAAGLSAGFCKRFLHNMLHPLGKTAETARPQYVVWRGLGMHKIRISHIRFVCFGGTLPRIVTKMRPKIVHIFSKKWEYV